MKKGFIVFMAFAMVLSYSVVLSPVAGAASDGDLIKGSGSAVYYLNGGKRYVFPNQKTYMTWYPDFSGVVTVSDSELSGYPLGGNVTYRAGTRLVKIDTVPTVYAVEPGGVLRSILSEANAAALWGSDWNKKIDDVPDSFWVNYSVGSDLDAGMYPTGSLVKEEGSATTYYIDGSDKRPIATGDAFDANMFNWSFLQTASDLSGYSDGASISGAESDLTKVAGDGSVVTGGSVSVALSSDTPATTTYIKSQARAPFLVVTFTNASSADVVVDSMTIERGGLSIDADITSVSAYEDMITGEQIGVSKTTWSTDDQMTIGGDVTVPAGTVKKVYIAGTVGSGAGPGDTPKLGLVAVTLKGGATLGGSLPIWGNQMELNTAITLAAVTASDRTSTHVDNASPKIGDTDIKVAAFRLANGSESDVNFEKLVLRNAGNAADSDVDKYNLIDDSDGSVLATGMQVEKYISFDLATPEKIEKSKNLELRVEANEILNGTSNTIDLDIYRDTDVLVKDLTYDAYVAPSGLGTGRPSLDSDDTLPTELVTIGSGTLKVEVDGDFDEGNVSENADGVQIAQWLFTVKGEPIDITELEATIDYTPGTADATDFTNAAFFNAETGVVLAGSVDPSSTYGVSSTDTITLGVGIHKIGLKVDLSEDFTSGETVYAHMVPATYVTAEGTISGESITDSSTTLQNSPSTTGMTIKAGSVSISMKSQAAQTVVKGGTGVEVGVIQLDATGSGSNLTVSQLKLLLDTTTMSPDELSSLKLYDGSTELNLSNDPDTSLTSAASANVTTTFTLSPTLSVTKGSVKELTVKVNVGSTVTATTDSFFFQYQGGATVKDGDGEDVAPTTYTTNGPVSTIAAAGALTINKSDDFENGYLNGEATGVTIGEFKMKAANDTVKVESFYVDVAAYEGGGLDEFADIYLYEGTTQILKATVTSTDAVDPVFFNFSTPLEIEVGNEREFKLVVDTPVIDESGDTPTSANPVDGFTVSILSTSFDLVGDATANSATLTFASYVVVKSQPTVVIASTGDSLTANGTYDLIDVTVAADSSGPIGLYKLSFKVATTTVTASSFEVYEGTTLVASESAIPLNGITKTYTDASHVDLDVYFNKQSIGGELREVTAGNSKTYTLKATVTGYDGTTSNGISTSLYGDADYLTADYEAAATAAVDAHSDFIWSDLSYGNTSTTATTTIQWINGYNVNGMVDTTSSAKAI